MIAARLLDRALELGQETNRDMMAAPGQQDREVQIQGELDAVGAEQEDPLRRRERRPRRYAQRRQPLGHEDVQVPLVVGRESRNDRS
jgi:hypothetical protein